MKVVTSTITQKYMGKGMSPLTGGIWFMDTVFERPTTYFFVLEDGYTAQVSAYTFYSYEVGDWYESVRMEASDWGVLFSVLTFFILVFVVLLVLINM